MSEKIYAVVVTQPDGDTEIVDFGDDLHSERLLTSDDAEHKCVRMQKAFPHCNYAVMKLVPVENAHNGNDKPGCTD